VTAVAGTPSLVSPVASSETLEQLEFARALDLVAGHAVSELGAAAVRRRRPSPSVEEAREDLAAVAEMMAVCQEHPAFAPRAVTDLRPTLKILHTDGGVLEAEALRELGTALGAMRETGTQLLNVRDEAPRVGALAVELPPERLEKAIERAIDPDGRVTDDASPGVKRARRNVRETRARLVQILERLLRTQSPHEAPPDGGVTLRGGRYVIPIRRDARAHLRGIVHGESSSGATVFVEPTEAVELGNDLNAAVAEEAREVLALLRQLTEDARAWSVQVEDGWRMCIRADDLFARARYALAVEAHVPTLLDTGGPSIRDGYHPLILADAARPTGFDLEIAPGERTIVVSGPNAGGKTVLLKAVGLVHAMAQAGVVPPVGKGTALPVFRRIACDIGDHQSIEANLSTFSAHVAALKAILLEPGDRSLVLLDELGGGTDPQEGAALAGAILLALHGSGAVTIATTHLGDLKELAARTEGVVNASLEFDAETLAPTYRFLKGKPGRSYALAIARRLGMPDGVLAVADDLTPEAARSLEATLAEVERREAALAAQEDEASRLHARLEADTIKLERDRNEAERRLSALSRREIELEKIGREQARGFLLEARRRVEDALGIARQAVNAAAAREARKLVEEGVSEEGDALKRLESQLEKKGWKVKGRNQVSGVRGQVSDGRVPKTPDTRPLIPDTSSSQLDLRGFRADEAEALVIQAIDGAVMGDLPVLRIIHGKGTGALRSVVTETLKRDSRVQSFKLADVRQGGSGVTVVEFEP